MAALIAIPIAYVLALLFIVPPTEEAHAVASVLFAWCGVLVAAYGYLLWRLR